MPQAGSIRVIASAACIALSIIALKFALPNAPMLATVTSGVLGLALIFSLYHSDVRRRKGLRNQPVRSEPMDTASICDRLEARPLPQVSVRQPHGPF